MNKSSECLVKNDGRENGELARIDDLEIAPISDDELDAVAGGYTDSTTAASCACCGAGATIIRTTVGTD
jgi:hypothetical protein